MLDFSAFFPGLHRELLRRGVDFSRGQMLRASVLTLVMVLAACAAPVHQAESGTAATTAAADTTNAEAVAPPIAAAGAIWPPRMPAAGNFEEVPLGKWADYEETYLG